MRAVVPAPSVRTVGQGVFQGRSKLWNQGSKSTCRTTSSAAEWSHLSGLVASIGRERNPLEMQGKRAGKGGSGQEPPGSEHSQTPVPGAEDDPIGCRPPGSSAHGILQARILEHIAIPFFRGPSQRRDSTQVSCITGRFFYFLSHKGSPKRIICPAQIILIDVDRN